MKILRLTTLLAGALSLAACGTLNRMFQAGGRALHLNSETTKSPDHFRLEAHEVRESLAGGAKAEIKPEDPLPELARR